MSRQNHKNRQQSSHSHSPVMSTVPQRPYETEGQSKQQEIEGQHLPSYREIEVLAYQIHEEKGGTDVDNWLEAERVLKERYVEYS